MVPQMSVLKIDAGYLHGALDSRITFCHQWFRSHLR